MIDAKDARKQVNDLLGIYNKSGSEIELERLDSIIQKAIDNKTYRASISVPIGVGRNILDCLEYNNYKIENIYKSNNVLNHLDEEIILIEFSF